MWLFSAFWEMPFCSRHMVFCDIFAALWLCLYYICIHVFLIKKRLLRTRLLLILYWSGAAYELILQNKYHKDGKRYAFVFFLNCNSKHDWEFEWNWKGYRGLSGNKEHNAVPPMYPERLMKTAQCKSIGFLHINSNCIQLQTRVDIFNHWLVLYLI